MRINKQLLIERDGEQIRARARFLPFSFALFVVVVSHSYVIHFFLPTRP